jgi:hypothetical protein
MPGPGGLPFAVKVKEQAEMDAPGAWQEERDAQ